MAESFIQASFDSAVAHSLATLASPHLTLKAATGSDGSVRREERVCTATYRFWEKPLLPSSPFRLRP